MTASWETAVVTGCSEVLEQITWTHGIKRESLSVAAAAKTPFAPTVSIAVAGASSFRARLLLRAKRTRGMRRPGSREAASGEPTRRRDTFTSRRALDGGIEIPGAMHRRQNPSARPRRSWVCSACNAGDGTAPSSLRRRERKSS
jgi:hypothetical protein